MSSANHSRPRSRGRRFCCESVEKACRDGRRPGRGWIKHNGLRYHRFGGSEQERQGST